MALFPQFMKFKKFWEGLSFLFLFNICIVLGLPIVIYGDMALAGFGIVDIVILFLSSFLLFWFARSERTISRKEAIIMLAIFAFYYAYLII